eukprot:scaffold326353_cov55-Tisochrysis_lutea.AAC.4
MVAWGAQPQVAYAWFGLSRCSKCHRSREGSGGRRPPPCVAARHHIRPPAALRRGGEHAGTRRENKKWSKPQRPLQVARRPLPHVRTHPSH